MFNIVLYFANVLTGMEYDFNNWNKAFTNTWLQTFY